MSKEILQSRNPGLLTAAIPLPFMLSAGLYLKTKRVLIFKNMVLSFWGVLFDGLVFYCLIFSFWCVRSNWYSFIDFFFAFCLSN